MSECTHNCETCGSNCSSRESLVKPANDFSQIKKVIGVVSGKGGVGKSLVTGLSASWARREGYNTAILDADITGPSVPKIFGLHQRAQGSELGLLPVETKSGIKVMSLNLLLNNETDPVVWRGPVIAGTVQQFWTDVVWGDVDFMFVDMPPGTGDVPLTVFQSIPIDAIIVVTSPQELVSLIVEKALNMAELMQVPVLGIVENMSYIECPDCRKRINVFGESKIDEIAAEKGIDVIGRIPIVPEVAASADNGDIESVDADKWIADLEGKLKNMI